MPNPGDLCFFHPDPGDVWMEVIARATGGPYAHVAICDAGGALIEALGGHGVTCDGERPAALVIPTGAACAHLDMGVKWAEQQIGKPYSYAQLAEDGELIVLHALNPQVAVGPFVVSVPAVPLGQLIQPGAFDCSSLAARFLQVAGYEPLPRVIEANPDAMSPNSLARALGARW